VVIAFIMGISGAVLLVIPFTPLGGKRDRKNIGVVSSLCVIAGLLLLCGAIVYGHIVSDRELERKNWNETLAKVLGGPPDQLDLQGVDLESFHGTCQYEGKAYKLETFITGGHDTPTGMVTKFEIRATPIDSSN
jgi:hypothetical protein